MLEQTPGDEAASVPSLLLMYSSACWIGKLGLGMIKLKDTFHQYYVVYVEDKEVVRSEDT